MLAARVGGNPELVLPEETGLLYDPVDSDGLSGGLLRYLEEPAIRESHGRAGRARVLARFSLDSMIQRYLDIYDELTCAA